MLTIDSPGSAIVWAGWIAVSAENAASRSPFFELCDKSSDGADLQIFFLPSYPPLLHGWFLKCAADKSDFGFGSESGARVLRRVHVFPIFDRVFAAAEPSSKRVR